MLRYRRVIYLLGFGFHRCLAELGRGVVGKAVPLGGSGIAVVRRNGMASGCRLLCYVYSTHACCRCAARVGGGLFFCLAGSVMKTRDGVEAAHRGCDVNTSGAESRASYWGRAP